MQGAEGPEHCTKYNWLSQRHYFKNFKQGEGPNAPSTEFRRNIIMLRAFVPDVNNFQHRFKNVRGQRS